MGTPWQADGNLSVPQTLVQWDRLTLTELSQQIWSYKYEPEAAVLRKIRGLY